MADTLQNNELKMSFDPNTVQHLGIKMYSHLPAAIAELVANAYDAAAKEVHIKLYDDGADKKILVQDNGHGMSFDEVNNHFLKIGRNRRSEGLTHRADGKVVTGKKGLGKLALFGIGSEIGVATTKIDSSEGIHFVLKWNVLKNWNSDVDGPDYKPTFERQTVDVSTQGTTITISDLKRKSEFNIEDLAKSLSRMFNFLDDNFKVQISLNDGQPIAITNELKYQNLDEQFSWQFPEFSEEMESQYQKKALVKGKIIATKKPLSPGERGITLFARGRLVNMPEFFGSSESSYFFSYTTGWLEVDFIDDLEEDVISTNRQALDWENEELAALKSFLQAALVEIHRQWREKRKEENKKDVQVQTGIDRAQWLATLPPDKAEIIDRAYDRISAPDVENPVSILIDTVHQIAPEYAELHWRYLNQKIIGSDVIKRLYVQRNYFQAASEAVKLYVEEVRRMSGSTNTSDNSMMGEVFGEEQTRAIGLTDKSDVIEKDIDQGQKHYSMGVVTGFKNPVTSHATESSLKQRGLFVEKDCLDVLSLLSHLFSRLEKAKKPAKATP